MNWVLVVPNTRSTSEPNLALAGGRRFLGAFVARQERLEVGAAEFGSPVNHYALGQAVMPAHALPEHHHAGAVARLLEVHMEHEDAARKRIDHQRHPWPAELVRAGRVGQFDVQLGMVKMTDLKRPVAMARRLQIQFHVE